MGATMQAAYLNGHGGPEVIEVGDVPRPEISCGEVRVKLKYGALNHLDVWVRKGLPGLGLSYPHILGGDGAGVVDEVGSQVTHVAPGDEVMVHPGLTPLHQPTGRWESLTPGYQILGEHVDGTHGQYVKVPAANVFLKPPSLPFPEAASVGLVFTTAWQMVVHRAQVKPGEWVLIHAAGSGVSSAAIQIASLFGARIITTAGSQEKLDAARGLGAEHGILYRETDFAQAVRDITKGGVDVVLDHVGVDTWEKNFKAMKRGARMVLCGASSGFEARTDLRQVFYRQLQILGSTMGAKEDFPQILTHLTSGRFQAVVDREFPLAEARQAHRYLEQGNQFGKVVLRIP